MEIINRNISFAIPTNDMDEEHIARIEEVIVEAISHLGYTCEIEGVTEIKFEKNISRDNKNEFAPGTYDLLERERVAWKEDEVNWLKGNVERGYNYCSQMLGRSAAAIQTKYWHLMNGRR